MKNLVSTYRVQLHAGFTLSHLTDIVPYLRQLGVKTIYAAPILAATPGSSHGYDGVDAGRISTDIGTAESLLVLSQTLREAGIGWLQDIVPNHMAYHQTNNWLLDVLEHGSRSRYAHFFDIDWAEPGRLMAPFLPKPLPDDADDTTRPGGLSVKYDRDRLMLASYDNEFPLAPATYATLLTNSQIPLPPSLQTWIGHLPAIDAEAEPEPRAQRWDEARNQLAGLLLTDDQCRAALDDALLRINQRPAQLRQLADAQPYRLCVWHETAAQINYRRFFTVNGLICLNMQDERVFDQDHQLIGAMVGLGIMQGVRVDHVDGLYDPAEYLQRLRGLLGEETYIAVEKIQQADEPLPAHWPIEGTSGYDFLAMVNNLLTDSRSEAAFTDFYTKLVGYRADVPADIRDRKAFILFQTMGGELDNLLRLFQELHLADDAEAVDLPPALLKLAIGQWLIWCPVYRYYANQMPLPADEAEATTTLFDRIETACPDLSRAVTMLRNCLLINPETADADYRARALRFYQRAMQFSGPLMAKGVEDTLMYVHNRFIGHNEVGDGPARFGLATADFHALMADRQTHWPLTMNTTATHDTKRGEDSRARLNVLTDLPDDWLTEVQHWQTLNADLKPDGNSPDANDEYFIYQALLAGWPMSGQPEDDFAERFLNYLDKAWREAKRHVQEWGGTDAYLQQVRQFVTRLLDPARPFWARFAGFHETISDFGIINSLVQTVLKYTCPGLPDLYQGGELWDLSFVDPDNRRPVDFVYRQQVLTALLADTRPAAAVWHDLWQDRRSGRVKLWLTHHLLRLRADWPALFAGGRYQPLTIEGSYREHLLAFARQHESGWVIVVVPLHPAQVARQQQKTDLAQLDWRDTTLVLPPDAPTRWRNHLTGETLDNLMVNSLFAALPAAVLVGE